MPAIIGASLVERENVDLLYAVATQVAVVPQSVLIRADEVVE
jgi:hypothetical protein